MTTISMLDFRRDAQSFIRRALKGEYIVLSYRGKPVIRLEPIRDEKEVSDDPFYHLCQYAVDGESITNEDIDKVIYEC